MDFLTSIKTNTFKYLNQLSFGASKKLPIAKTCADIPIYTFVKVVTTGDTSLIPDWEAIYTEYSELTNSSASSAILDLSIDITYLTNRLNLVNSIINRLSLRFNQELFDLLTEMGFVFPYGERYIEMVITKSKGDLMRLRQREAEYLELAKDDTNATLIQWEEYFSELGKFQGYPITENTTILQYIAIDNRYKRYVKMKNTENRSN